MMRRALKVVAAALAMSGPAVASDKPYFRQVQGRIELARTSLAPTGWKLERVFTGSLAQGSAGFAALPLEPGRQYKVVGRCDDDCSGLDLFLNRDDQPIDRDVDHDKLPSIDYEPRYTGNFTVSAGMVGCTAATCRYGLALFSR